MDRKQLSYFFRHMNAWTGKWEQPPKTEPEWGQAMAEAEGIWKATGSHPLGMQLIQTVLLYWEQSTK